MDEVRGGATGGSTCDRLRLELEAGCEGWKSAPVTGTGDARAVRDAMGEDCAGSEYPSTGLLPLAALVGFFDAADEALA